VEPHLQSIFLRHVAEQAGFGFSAWQNAKLALQRMDLAHNQIRERKIAPDQWEIVRQANDDFWMYVQLTVASASNVVKLLWGQGRTREADRAEVRIAVGGLQGSPLIEKHRNHWEHIDERIERWSQMPAGTRLYADRTIGSTAGMVRFEGAEPQTEDFFRSYNPATGVLHFWGDQLSLFELEGELRRVRDAANRAIAAPGNPRQAA
jgi:hypothetical protein